MIALILAGVLLLAAVIWWAVKEPESLLFVIVVVTVLVGWTLLVVYGLWSIQFSGIPAHCRALPFWESFTCG